MGVTILPWTWLETASTETPTAGTSVRTETTAGTNSQTAHEDEGAVVEFTLELPAGGD